MAAAALLLACHLAMLFVSQALDSAVEFSSRMFAPVHYLLTVMAVTALGTAWQVRHRARLLATAAAGIVFAGSAWKTAELLRESRTVGIDHARPEERLSPTLAWLRTRGRGLPIYANEPAKIYFHLQRPSRVLPWIVTADTLRHLDQVLHDRPGYVVWFTAGRAESYVPGSLLGEALTPDKLTSAIPLAVVAEFADGVIWIRDSTATRATKPVT
jgi:hypothetical protein